MPTTKLELYNGAIRWLGDAPLASLTENAERRRSLDDVYTRALLSCLEQGLWNFATRSMAMVDAASIEPAFGYTYAFTKPTDWVRTVAVSADPRFDLPLRDYNDEQGYIYTNITPVYLSYVSNDPAYGLDTGKWPQLFCDFVEAHLATRICPRTVQNKDTLDMLLKVERAKLLNAQSKDAMNQPAKAPPPGSWASARGRSYSSSDRGR